MSSDPRVTQAVVDLDDELLVRAQRALGTATKRDTVDEVEDHADGTQPPR